MLKMYQVAKHEGGAPQLWEENWAHNDFEAALQFCQTDPLRPLFERHARAGTIMLEGGCGQGHYVAYYSSQQMKVVGLDFARQTLSRLKELRPDLMLCAGDVAELPFADSSFDLYYSGGVVEHFEGGPERALKEARRVLRPEGILLISVPYLNLLRRVLTPIKSSLWKKVSSALVDAPNGEARFFQYVYSQPEFERLLRQAGLRVITTQGYGILWGLYDLNLFQTVIEKMSGRNSSSVETHDTGPSTHPLEAEAGKNLPISDSAGGSAMRNILKRLIVKEDRDVPLVGLGIPVLRRVCANMMMYVCRPI